MLESLSLVNEDTPVRLMMFDFVELGGDDAKTEEQRISSIYQHLKGIAKTLDIPVLALSQLNRDVEKRADRLPSISDLRGSGMGEQIADRIALIMRPEYYFERGEELKVPEADKKGIAYVQIAKNRNGPVGMLRMGFKKERSMFHDLLAPALGQKVDTTKAILQPPQHDRMWA
jgi:replicative DNA helicase